MAVCVALATATLCLAAFVVASESFVARIPHYLVKNDRDDYGYLTSKVISIRQAATVQKGFAVLGASCIQSGVTTGAELTRLAQMSDPEVRGFDLGSSDQSFWESFAVLDHIAPRFSGVALLGINPWRLRRMGETTKDFVDSPRLGIVSEYIESRLAKIDAVAPRRTGFYVYDNRKFLLARLRNVPRNLFWGAIHEIDEVEPRVLRWDGVIEGTRKQQVNFDEEATAALQQLDGLITDMRARGIDFVMVDAPIAPDFPAASVGDDFYAAYRERIRTFAAERNIRFWDANVEANLVKGDFADWCHMSQGPGRQRMTNALVDLALEELSRGDRVSKKESR
ncbi:MAG: hypothetical protein K0U93_03015 [Gammaproteobacteria bacterium]|nr:hypothetical protein [Gammaproteobacteria bacterium]